MIRVYICISLFSLTFGNSSGQISGIKSINPSGGDYASFSAAVSALSTQGINGPVVFNVANGTYNEQVTIPEITGASAVNTITFQSQAGDSSLVILTFASSSSTSNFTLKLDNTDYINIRKMTLQASGTTYGRVIELNGTATNTVVENCRLVGYNSTSVNNDNALIFSLQDPTSQLTIQKNLFLDGSYGIYIEGVNATTLSSGTRILGNTFQNTYETGIYLKYQSAPEITSNNISLKAQAGYGMYMEYCDNSLKIQKNTIQLPSGEYGIYLYLCDGNSLAYGQVVNNFVSITAGGNASGVYIYNSTYQKIYHNSVSISAITTSDHGAFYLNGGSNIDVRNNIFANFGENYALNVKTPAALDFCDYNDYYSNGNFLAFWAGKKEDLAQLVADQAPLKDANSVSFNPVFVSSTNLHAGSFRIDNKGTNLGITEDIDGQVRTNYDIGADEFTGTGTALAAGTYTIGGTSPNFPSFTAAAAVLNAYGINGNVTFSVRNGTYTEQFTLGPIAGSSASSKVTFQSESGDSTKAELSFNSISASNYLVRFQGADFVTFRKLSFTSLNSTYGRIFWYTGSSLNNTITSCILNGIKTGTTYDPLIGSYESNVNNLTISYNLLSGGGFGVSLNPNTLNKSTGNKIIGNTITSQGGNSYPEGVYIRYHDAPEVRGNKIENFANLYFYGIYLQDCSNEILVTENKISTLYGDGGIYLYNCKSINTKRGLVANNFIEVGGTSTAYGITTYNTEYQNIYFNSVRITSTNITSGRAYYNTGSSNNISLRNNLFTNFGDGYAFYSDGTTSNFISDYNDFYSTGNFLFYWNGVNYNSLASFKTAAAPLDANSLQNNPVFMSGSDLHAQSSFINNAGSPVAEVLKDIDGQTRSLTTPDIGADEFSSALAPLAAGTYTIGGSSPNFPDFTSAVAALNTKGVSGPVIFNVRNGTYNEQITLLDINGSSTLNNIVFQSESGDSSKVELVFSGNVNSKYIVQLSGSDFITFRKMTFSALNTTYAVIFFMKGGVQKLSIQNCVLNGNGTTAGESNSSVIYSGNGVFTDLLIDRCQFNGGYSAVWLESPAAGQSVGTRILNSDFSAQYNNSIMLKYQNAPVIENNTIANISGYTYFTGVFLSYCSNDLLVQGNYIKSAYGGTGIYLSYCVGNTSRRGLISNNRSDIGGTYITNGISIENSDYQRVYFNSVNITGKDLVNGRAFNCYNGTNHDVRNNIFKNFGGGYAYYTYSASSIPTSDYNNLFTTGNYIAYTNGNIQNLTDLRTLTGKETNSISVNPVFSAILRTASSFVNNKGIPIAAVTKDFEGQTRSAGTPDIGADEFTPTLVPMAGNYTIGGSAPDFATFTLAANALNERGVSGPVIFNVRNGTYTEHFEMFEISGSNAVNNIIFQSESGDSTSVNLNYTAASTDQDFVLKLTGTDFLTIKKLTITGTGTNYSTLMVLVGNVSQLKVENCIFNVNDNSSGNAILCNDGSYISNILIRRNNFTSGNAINLNGSSALLSPGIEISENNFTSQKSVTIRLEDMESPIIKANRMSSNYYGNTGIFLYNCDGKLNASENKIFCDNYSTGIYLSYCNGTLVNQGLASNNIISLIGASYVTGISLNYSEYQNILFNSVNIASSYSGAGSKIGFYQTGGDNIFVRNNIFACTLGGYAYYVNTPTAVDASDYNNYYSTTDLAYWGGNRASLTELRTANSADANSVSANPLFASASDLHTKQTILHKAATPQALVTKDIYGVARDVLKPDIGAIEFSCSAPVFSLTTATSCFGDSTVFNYSITKVSYGSNFSFDFDNDFNPDTSFTSETGIIRYLFSSPGTKTINLISSQIAGCNDYTSKTINIEPSPVFDLVLTGAYCGDDNGSASVSITGDTYSYNWSNGNKTSSATNLAKGKYSVTVKNQNNCISTRDFEIGDRIVTTITELSPSTCGQEDGSAVVTASGGAGTYSFVWSNGETLATAIKLPSGPNYVDVIDGGGCSVIASVNISTDPSGPKISLKNAVHNSCYGDKKGSIDVNITGGNKPYSIRWSNGASTEDITGLGSGIYDLKVTDNTGCVASASFGIEQPVFLNLSAVVENASCSGSDGKAIALAGGGTKPYRYQWSEGSAGPVAENLAAGIYTLTLTDNNNCSVVTPVIVNNAGGPTVNLNKLTGVSCTGTAVGSIDISVSGGTPLYGYSWLPGGQTTQDINNLSEGTYTVNVTDNAGCIGVNSFVVSKEPPAVNPICLVTVDSTSGYNLVVWEKLSQPDLTFYNIYRESSSKGIFQLAGIVPATEPGEFTDTIADPALRSWKYRISAVDICGNESDLSNVHKTIHLTQSVGINRTVNLIWDKYEGFDLNTYKILRYSKAAGWRNLDNLPSDQTSYTDIAPPLDAELYYVIEVENPNGSCSTLKASSYNSARSNRQGNTVSSTLGQTLTENFGSLVVYPNPAKSMFFVELNKPGMQKVAMELVDSKGQTVRNYFYKVNADQLNAEIDVQGITPGIYILKISSDMNVNLRKLVIQP